MVPMLVMGAHTKLADECACVGAQMNTACVCVNGWSCLCVPTSLGVHTSFPLGGCLLAASRCVLACVCAPVSLPSLCLQTLHVYKQLSPTPAHNQSHRKSLGSTEGDGESRPGKYCCVYLPDGTASLALARPGLTIRDMLAGICEKRGLSLPDIKVYLVGNEQVRT